MAITDRDREDMRAWLETQGLAPTPPLVDALIQLLRRMEEPYHPTPRKNAA